MDRLHARLWEVVVKQRHGDKKQHRECEIHKVGDCWKSAGMEKAGRARSRRSLQLCFSSDLHSFP